MKVLHLAGGGDVGGAKSHIIALARELGKHCEVRLVSFRAGLFHDDAVKAGIDARVIHSGNLFRDVRRLVRIIREGGFDIVHSHGSKANMMSVAARLFTRFTSVSTIHSDYRHDYMHSVARKYTFGVINRIALTRIEHYVAVSSTFQKMLTERRFKPSRIHVLYNGIDFDAPIPEIAKRAFHEKYGVPDVPGEVLVAIVARLHPVKDLPTFLRGAAEALKSAPTLRFLVLGDGDDLHGLRALADTLRIGERVHFLGFVAEPYEVLRHIDINTLTSLSESFPYVILEGARLSKPIVATKVGGLPALITEGETGLFFEPGDWKAFGAALARLANDASLRERLGANLLRKARENFSVEGMGSTQLAIYERILQRKKVLAETGKAYDVAISGYYGYKNSGDDAILMAIVNSLRQADPEIRILVFSATPVETSLALDVDGIMRFNIVKVRRAIATSRLLVYGGGNLLQDDTSTRSLLYYLGILWLAEIRRTRTMLFAAGIGPIRRALNKRLSRLIIDRVDCITLRESLSADELRALGVTRPRVEVTADPVMTIPVDSLLPPGPIFSAEGIPESGRYAAVSVRDWPVGHRFENLVAGACDHLVDRHGLTPIFVGMQYPDDVRVGERIAAKMKRKAYVLKGKYSVAATLGVISRVELLIGMRLHSLIYAAGLAIPLIALPYEPKVEAFLQTLRQPAQSAGDLASLTPERLRDLIDRTLADRAGLSSAIESAYASVRDQARRNVEIVFELLDEGGHPHA